MPFSRRRLLQTGFATAAGLGAGAMLPTVVRAAAATRLEHTTDGPDIVVHPVSHASFVLETPAGVIYNDPVGGADAYADLPAPDLILITHEHGDHYDVPTLEGLVSDATPIITNLAVFGMLPESLQGNAEGIGNGETTTALGYEIEAIPAYNLTEERLQFHPQGRDNGYVLNIGELRIYIAGDTEAIPEMRALENIDVAFVPMNLPYTMDVEQAAAGVAEFGPTIVYPYHYRGSDVDRFEQLLADAGSATEVMRGAWYS